MARVIPIAQRISKARVLMQKARDLPLPAEQGWMDFSYAANVRDILRQARDLLKFIQFMPNASVEAKREAEELLLEINRAEKEILHKS